MSRYLPFFIYTFCFGQSLQVPVYAVKILQQLNINLKRVKKYFAHNFAFVKKLTIIYCLAFPSFLIFLLNRPYRIKINRIQIYRAKYDVNIIQLIQKFVLEKSRFLREKSKLKINERQILGDKKYSSNID